MPTITDFTITIALLKYSFVFDHQHGNRDVKRNAAMLPKHLGSLDVCRTTTTHSLKLLQAKTLKLDVRVKAMLV